MAETFVVERRETITATPKELFAHIGTLQGLDGWSPWNEMDPGMTKTYSGEPGAVGSSYHWSGNRKVGEGRMTITDVKADESVTIDLEFVKPFKSKNITELRLAPKGAATEVTWQMTGPKTFLTRVMALIGKNMDKMVGPDFEKGLGRLKAMAES